MINQILTSQPRGAPQLSSLPLEEIQVEQSLETLGLYSLLCAGQLQKNLCNSPLDCLARYFVTYLQVSTLQILQSFDVKLFSSIKYLAQKRWLNLCHVCNKIAIIPYIFLKPILLKYRHDYFYKIHLSSNIQCFEILWFATQKNNKNKNQTQKWQKLDRDCYFFCLSVLMKSRENIIFFFPCLTLVIPNFIRIQALLCTLTATH